MINEREQALRERFNAREVVVPPSDWGDVQRRAAAGQSLQRRVVPQRTHGWLGAALGVAAAIGVAAILLIATGVPSSGDPASYSSPIRTGHFKTTSAIDDKLTVTSDLLIDFERRIAQTESPTAVSTIDDPISPRTVTTPERSYLFVPDELRTRTNGRPWISVATRGASPVSFDSSVYADPNPERFGGIKGAGLLPQGQEILNGVTMRRYRVASAITGSPEASLWVDQFGRVRRVEYRTAERVTSLSRLEYNEPINLDIPSSDETFEVATLQEADLILRPVQ